MTNPLCIVPDRSSASYAKHVSPGRLCLPTRILCEHIVIKNRTRSVRSTLMRNVLPSSVHIPYRMLTMSQRPLFAGRGIRVAKPNAPSSSQMPKTKFAPSFARKSFM